MQKFWNLTFVALLIFILTGCENTTVKRNELSSFIPQNTETVLKIKNWETTAQDFQKNHFLNGLNNEPFSTFFNQKKSIFQYLKPNDKVLLCAEKLNDSTRHFTLITKISPKLFQPDSIPEAKNIRINFNGNTITKTTLKEREVYSVQLDSTFVISTSELLLKKSIEGKTQKEVGFLKAFKLKSDNELAYVKQLQPIIDNDTSNYRLASFASFELQILPDGVVGSGVVLEQDSLPQLISLFKGQIPQKNDAPTIVPMTARNARSFTFNNLEQFQKNLQKFKGDSIKIDPLFETINEIVEINLPNENALALKSLDGQLTWAELAKYISEKETFREIPLFSFTEEKTLFSVFSPLLKDTNYNLVFQWEDFLVFTKNQATAEQLITHYQNHSVLSNAVYFENSSTQLAQASSLMHYTLDGKIDGLFAELLGAKTASLKNFPLATLQLIYDRDFAHLNLVCKEINHQKQNSGLVNQVFSIELEREVLGTPKFFTNHNTSGKDIVVQDISNVLYFISTNGKILWKKQLDGAILGTINEVDLLRNGKKQLTFTTAKTWYVLDRNGDAVSPFPKKFKETITQPLSVFDYDNNRKYRFVITQGKNILMYDSQGNTVNGFTFKNTSSTIVLPPQHIRMGNKDYIVIAEQNGKLSILTRVGKERIKVNKTFNFSAMPIEKEGTSFVVISKDNNKSTITQEGKIHSESLQVSKNYWFTILGSTKVTLDDHLLRINGQLVELPLGVYSKPQVFLMNKEVYIAVTEINENKVFLYHKSGKLLSNFPVFGSSEIDLGDANKNKKINLVVKGQPKELILYQAN
ncbi:MAG: hypothetical protein R2781_05790 [Flavobacteriaceae bacterium]